MYWIYLSLVPLKIYISSIFSAFQNFWSAALSDYGEDYEEYVHSYVDMVQDNPNFDTSNGIHPSCRKKVKKNDMQLTDDQ